MESYSTVETSQQTREHSAQPLHAAQLADALLKIQTVCAVTGLSASSIHRKVAERTFPSPVRLGARCTRWKSAEVAAWVRGQEAGR